MPVRPLSPALAEKARIELGEDANVFASSVRELKEWIAEQPHLRARTDDQWLAAFLRGCKFRLPQAKAKIDLYYSLRSTASDLYQTKYDNPKIMDLINLGSAVSIPKIISPADPRVILLRIASYNPKEYNYIELMTLSTLLQQILFMEDDNFTVAGMVHIVDFTNTSLAHLTAGTLRQIRNLVYAHQDAAPVRIKESHFIGAPYIFQSMFNFIKRFLSEKIRKRIYMHSNIESLYSHVSKEILPPEYGGTGPTMQENIDYLRRRFTDYREFFEEDLQYGTDETKRVKEVKKKEIPAQPGID